MRKYLVFTSFMLFAQFITAQDYNAEFIRYYEKKDTINQLKVLNEWEKQNPTTPEFFIDYFNYYIDKVFIKIESLDSSNTKDNNLYFIYKDLEKGFAKINKGIELNPNRLDMRFSKIYLLGELKDWEKHTDEILKTIKYSAENKNNWLWTKNEEVGEKVFLSILQSYQVELMTGKVTSKALENVRKISKEILKYYPNSLESLANLGVLSRILDNDCNKALEYFLQAEKIAPTDEVVLSGMGDLYSQTGNKLNAIKYYEKAVKYGGIETKKYAEAKINELEKHP